MRIELTEVFWLHEHHTLSVSQLAELSGLSESEINELEDYGVIAPNNTDSLRSFDPQSIVASKTARRLRDDFELTMHGVALALALLDRVRNLEMQLSDLRAQLPRRYR